ncbi:protein ZNF365 isoform X2 [Corythoichthys intestinalis]|nr:protein ZNF365 isoform X2 [Corythoichthys intestinalis]
MQQHEFCSGSFLEGESWAHFHGPDVPDVAAGYPPEYAGFSITGKLPPGRDGSLPARGGRRGLHMRSLSDGRDAARFLVSRRRTQSVGVATRADDGDVEDDNRSEDAASDEAPDHRGIFHPDLDLDEDPEWNTDLSGRRLSWGADEASSAYGAAEVLQRRLSRVRTELARADTRLLCERAHSQHLSRERQEVAEKERSLSRQVDVAVTVIAALKEQINASENELEWRERQVLTIQKFLEAAVRQETSGKVRIQRFIENLLRRIALAEMLLEDYQQRQTPSDRDKPQRITKSRSAGCQLSSGLHGNNAPSSRPPLGDPRDLRERLARSSRLFCRPEHRDDIWNQRQRSAGHRKSTMECWDHRRK